MKYALVLVSFCIMIQHIGFGQSTTGIVHDAETKEPLPFTNIVLVGQQRGTVSNSEGEYVLDLNKIDPTDTLTFSYVGYRTLKVSVVQVRQTPDIYLTLAPANLEAVEVSSRDLTAKEIIALIRENYPTNYPKTVRKERVFMHKYERVPFPEENQLLLKKSDFIGIDPELFKELYSKIPNEFVEYQDVLVELYSNASEQRLLPIEAISLEESSNEALLEEFQGKLETLFDDISKSQKDKEVYYRFRTGIIGMKMDGAVNPEDNESVEQPDSKQFSLYTSFVKTELQGLMREYSTIGSKNWEFITSPGKYNYKLGEVTLFNDDLVYQIAFQPKKGGLFEGQMYVSTSSFAVLQLDFAYADGKQTERIQLLGIGHAMNFKKGRVIFEQGTNGYYPKYIYVEQKEAGSVNRTFSILKKKKRFLFDKTMNKVKMKADMRFDINSYWEILVLEREEIEEAEFEQIKQPKYVKYRREYRYSPDMWENETVIAPSSELKKYKRK